VELTVGKMEMYMSLSGYELDLGCDRYSWDWMKKLCSKLDNPVDGYHSFQTLQDTVCNLEEQTFRILFRSCHDVQILTWTSLGCLFLIIFSLLLMFVPAASSGSTSTGTPTRCSGTAPAA